MRPLQRCVGMGLGLWLAVAAAGEARPESAEKKTPAGAEAGKPTYGVVIQDRAPVMMGRQRIGELAEGLRVEVRETVEGYSLVHVEFGTSWFEGWVRAAMLAPDSLAEVGLKVAPTRPIDVYRDQVIPGRQFLEVRVRFEPTEKSPPRVYFRFDDEKTADLYLTHGRSAKELPYGFVRQIEGVTRPTFERQEKRQTLLLKPGEELIETYVFSVPVYSRGFLLTLKDVTLEVPARR